MKFEKGDRVVGLEIHDGTDIVELKGTILRSETYSSTFSTDCAVEFDKNIHGHDCSLLGFQGGKDEHCWWVPAHKLKLLNKRNQIVEDLIINNIKEKFGFGESYAR